MIAFQKKKRKSSLIKVKMHNRKSFIYKFLTSFIKLIGLIAVICLLLSYLSPFVNPAVFWVFGLLGLLYPVFLIISLLVLVLAFWRKSRLKWVVLVVLLIGSPLHIRYFAFGSSNEVAKTETSINIMSYNVRLFNVYNWLNTNKADNKNKILKFIGSEAPAVLCLQEYYVDNDVSPYITLEEVIKSGAFLDYHQRLATQTSKRDYGIITLSKHPIIKKGTVVNDDADLLCIFTDIIKNKDTFRIYNTHLESIKFQQDDYDMFSQKSITNQNRFKKLRNMLGKVKRAYPKRVEQAKRIVAHAKEAPYPVIICGDFNDTPFSYVYNLFNTSFSDAFREAYFGLGRTYAGRVPAGRIDYLFYNEGFKVNDFKIQKEVLSDHYAIWSTFTFNTSDKSQ